MSIARESVGLFGGTFDPIHNGHLQLAKVVLDEAKLDSILFIPSLSPPHKPKQFLPYNHRLAMVQQAVAEHPYFFWSTVEKELEPPTYSVDMLERLKNYEMGQHRLFFILGSDTFLEIESWKKYTRVLEMIAILIVARPGYSRGKLDCLLKRLGYSKDDASWRNPTGLQPIRVVRHESIPEISSSELRIRYSRGLDNSHLVPGGVDRYILEHGLYLRQEEQTGQESITE
jgi:nicotinate-nucleotide adenylyltransferase